MTEMLSKDDANIAIAEKWWQFFFTWCKVRAWDGSKTSRAIPDETFCSARRYEDTCEKHLYKILPRMWGKERRSL